MKKLKYRSRTILTLIFTGINMSIHIITVIIVSFVGVILYQLGFLPESGSKFLFLGMFIISSLLVGMIVSYFGSRFPLHPVHKLIYSLNKLSEGNYKTRIYLGNSKISHELSESFNKLAQELENTEMLRSDFINNFSHEFKTPIVSILGFSKLLQKDTLTREQQREYLGIIEEESGRLAAMATNVLNLTKIENQSILTNVSEYNLSEQIRTCILLLEKKWSGKEIDIIPDFAEHSIYACEDQLKQVWINLIDNAVKFTPEKGRIEIGIRETDDKITVSVKNSGSEISDDDLPNIFRKFYRSDSAVKSSGNGLGLAIASEIVALHSGTIEAQSGGGSTTFTVTLPKI